VAETVAVTALLPATSTLLLIMALAETARLRLPATLADTALLPATSTLFLTMALADIARRAAILVVAIARLRLPATLAHPEAVQVGGAEVTGVVEMLPAETVVVALQAIPTTVRARDAEIGEQTFVSGKASLTPKGVKKFLFWVRKGTGGRSWQLAPIVGMHATFTTPETLAASPLLEFFTPCRSASLQLSSRHFIFSPGFVSGFSLA
jgi:hypothetical protein